VRAMADHIMVMKDGKLVEQGSPDQVMDAPREAYTRRLMAAAFMNERRSTRCAAGVSSLSQSGHDLSRCMRAPGKGMRQARAR